MLVVGLTIMRPLWVMVPDALRMRAEVTSVSPASVRVLMEGSPPLTEIRPPLTASIVPPLIVTPASLTVLPAPSAVMVAVGDWVMVWPVKVRVPPSIACIRALLALGLVLRISSRPSSLAEIRPLLVMPAVICPWPSIVWPAAWVKASPAAAGMIWARDAELLRVITPWPVRTVALSTRIEVVEKLPVGLTVMWPLWVMVPEALSVRAELTSLSPLIASELMEASLLMTEISPPPEASMVPPLTVTPRSRTVLPAPSAVMAPWLD